MSECKLIMLQNLGDIIGNYFWVLSGDFNLMSTLEEKKGGIKRLDQDNKAFYSFI